VTPTRMRLRRPPALEVVFEFEELPTLRVVAGSRDDEARLLAWVAQPAVQARLRDAVLDGFDRIREWSEAA
jgi:hypothetical protein